MIAQSPGREKPREEVPAEVSKRGVMIGNFEGALSSRRKRASFIIGGRLENAREKITFFGRLGGAFPNGPGWHNMGEARRRPK
jgi:hypothetical protein